jgi:hypothetical protein
MGMDMDISILIRGLAIPVLTIMMMIMSLKRLMMGNIFKSNRKRDEKSVSCA